MLVWVSIQLYHHWSFCDWIDLPIWKNRIFFPDGNFKQRTDERKLLRKASAHQVTNVPMAKKSNWLKLSQMSNCLLVLIVVSSSLRRMKVFFFASEVCQLDLMMMVSSFNTRNDPQLIVERVSNDQLVIVDGCSSIHKVWKTNDSQMLSNW